MKAPKDKVREDREGVADEQGDEADEQGDVVKLKKDVKALQVSKDEEELRKELGLGLGEKGGDEADCSVRIIPNKELLTMKNNCRWVYGSFFYVTVVSYNP